MAFNKDFLKSLSIPDDTAETIFAERGKELTSTNAKIAELESNINKLTENIAALTAEKEALTQSAAVDKENYSKLSADYESATKRISDMEAAEASRLAEEEAKAKDAELTSKIDALIGDKKFTSSYAKDGVYKDLKTAYNADNSVDLSKLLADITKDNDGIFANTYQKETKTDIDPEIAALRSVMGLK